MNDAQSNHTHARLETVLAKLRQKEYVHGEGRILRAGTVDGLVMAIVTEIGETILPRRLTLTPDTGAEFHLAAANRRLQALLSPAPKGAEALVDAALKDAEDENLPILLDILKSELVNAKTLTVSAARLAGSTFPSDVGVPSNILSRAWNLDAQASEASPSDQNVETFLTSLGDDVEGWIRIEGEEVTAEKGGEDFLAELSEQAALFLDGYFAKKETIFSEGASAIALGPHGPDGTAVLFVELQDISAFIAMPASLIGEVASRWQKVVLANP